jgi:cell division protein FtsB
MPFGIREISFRLLSEIEITPAVSPKNTAAHSKRRGRISMNTTRWFTALALAAFSAGAWAQTQTAANVAPASASVEAPATPAPSPEQQLRSELDQLKQLVRDQQQRIEALESGRKADPQPAIEVASTAPISSAPAKAQDSTPAPQANPPQAPNASRAQAVQSGSSDERIRNLEREIKALGPLHFSGDVRLRAEPFFGGPTDSSQDRARARIRVRFNANANLGSQFRTGISLASGDINDPTTTNQTLTGFYTRKAVALDQAFVEFTPDQFKNLTVIGGKFHYPWFNTELTWDKDLNPEGVAETLGFKIDTPVLKRIAFIGFQLPFAEIAGTAPTDKRITQQITYGGQIQTAWQLGPRATLSAFSGYYDYRGADSVAFALARANSKNPQTPLVGLLPLASGNPVQNSTYTTTATTIITVNGTAYPTGVTAVSNGQFGSKFGLFDNLAKIDINTGNARFPVTFIGDYVQNTEACANLKNIVAAPANTATTTYKQTLNAACASNQRRGYWAEGRVGRLQEKNDFQFGYTHLYIEREAVLGNFNYSDIRQGTNVTQHRFDMFYMFDKGVQLGFTALVGRPLASSEPWLERLQFDTVYVF